MTFSFAFKQESRQELPLAQEHLFIMDLSLQSTHHQVSQQKRPHTRSRACEMPSLILCCFKEPFTGMIESRFLGNDRTHRLSWKEACFDSHLRTSVKTVQGMCSERKMLFPGHPAFAAQHMLLHNGIYPQPSSRGAEYFMSLLNGEIIDDGTPEKSAIGFSIIFFSSVAFIRLSIKCLSWGKGKIFIAAADIKTELEPGAWCVCRGAETFSP